MIHTNSVRRQARGFTLVELLVVTLILSILMAVALPLYLNAVKDSRVKTNRANMQTIANAVQASYVASANTGTHTYFAGTVADGSLPDLPKAPHGPSGEVYTVTADTTTTPNTFYVSCTPTTDGGTGTAHGVGTFTPGADNQ